MADFYFKTTRIQALSLQIPASFRIISTLLLLLLVTGAWFFGIYKPLMTSYHHKAAYHSSLKPPEEIQASITKNKKKIEKLTRALKTVCIPDSTQVSLQDSVTSRFTELLSEIQRHSATKIEQSLISLASIQHLLFARHESKIQGSFEQIMQFLHLLEEEQVPLYLTHMSIHKNDDQLELILKTTLLVKEP